MDNGTLIDAYVLILEQYRKLHMSSGVLENIGMSGLWTIVKGSKEQAGVAFAFNKEHAVYGDIDTVPLLTLQNFIGKPLFEFADYLLNQDVLIINSALVATLNALTRPLILSDQLKINYGDYIYYPPSDDWLDFIHQDDNVTMIGYGPVGDILAHVKSCNVCDMRHKNAIQTLSIGECIEYGPKGVNIYGAADAEKLLSNSSVVLISGCTLVNGTIKNLIKWSSGARVIGVYGWSASILPEYLVQLGVNYISANQMLNIPEFYRAGVNGLETNWMLKNSFCYYLKFF